MLLIEKPSRYGSKGVLRHDNYHTDPKSVLGIVAIIIIICSSHDFTTKLSRSWDSKVKYAFNQPIYGRI